MSAPPRPGGPAANGPNGPNGAPRAPFIRRVQNSDPMRPRQKPRPKPAQSLPPKQNNQEQSSKEDVLDKEIAADFGAKIKVLQQQRAKNNGWSDRPSENIQDYPLVITKKSLLEGIRHHVMRLHKLKGDDDVDLTNQDQFPRPVTLHRRDPRLPPAHRMVVKEEPAALDPSEAAEAERLKQAKADKEAQRALDQAQIAPVTRETNPKPKQNNKKDKATAFYGKHSDAHKKQSGIRYEETLPWHLEDAEGRSGTWVGSYVASLSDTHVGLVIDGSRFRMIPLERWYRFDEKPKFETMSLDAAEKLMYEVKDVKRWVMKDKDRELLEKERAETRRFLSGPARVKTESETSRAARRNERQDDFELDISGDEFQDDDETPGFEADDEDAKDSKERIRREQNAANLFGEGEESKVEQEEREKELEKLRRKMIGKQTIKGLTKYEQAMEYEDDSSDNSNNPFTDSSDSEDSDEEVKKEEEEKKPQVASGSNTKGNTTPSKNAAKKGKLKRPGSPAISESSDNENARKKIKTGKSGSVVPSRGGTPIPGRPKVLGGATSDGEATGGEGSDGGALLKKKLKMKAAAAGARPGGTPSGSRAGSPAPPGQASASSSFNNRNSATPGIGSPPPSGAATGNGVGKVTAAEIVSVLARFPDGVSLSALIRMFANRIDKPGHISKKEWISLVKANAAFGPDKLMRPKTGGSANGGSTSMGQAA